MSGHGHDEHDSHGHDSHAAHDDHGHDDHGGHGHDEHGGHDDHGHGGHGEHWGDYNAKPTGPSTLPPVPAWGLALMGLILAGLLGTIVSASLTLAAAHGGEHPGSHDAHGSVEHGAGSEHKSGTEKKADH